MTPLSSLEAAAARLFGDVRTREAVLLTTRAGAIVYASPACARLLGVRPSALRNRSWQSLLHPQEPAPLTDLHAIGPRGLVRAQRLAHPCGHELWVEASVRVVRPDPVRLGDLLWILHDVSVRHLADSAKQASLAALERSRAELRESQRMAHLGTWCWHVVDDVLEWSDELHMIYGVQLGTPMDLEAFIDCIHPDDRRGAHHVIERALRTGRPYTVTHRVVRPDGSIRVVEGHGRVEMDDQGRPLRVVGTCQDVTSLAHVREAALSASRLKAEFLSSMSQHVRTPMNGVMGMLDLLADTSLSQEQLQYCAGIRACCDGLLLVTNGLFDLSKMEAGRLFLHMDPFDLHAMLEQAAAVLLPQAQQKGLGLHLEVDPQVCRHVRGDAARIRQVLSNLVVNAITLTSEGDVRVRARQVMSEPERVLVRFEVEDSGVGLSRRQQEALFKLFSENEPALASCHNDTEMGLAICQRLARLMDGDIGLESAEGGGTIFYFTCLLPRAEITTTPSHLPQLVLRGRVLIAEDNAVNQLVAVKTLERFGCAARVAKNGREALEALESGAYDLVLMDCQMPEMDGFEAARAIRHREHRTGERRVPIVAVTAHLKDVDATRCLDAGMDDCISKPVDRAQLAGVLSRWLTRDVAPEATAKPG